LVDTFIAAGGVRPPEGDADALESALAALCERGRAGGRSFGVDDAAFLAHLARCGAEVLAPARSIHAEDLAVACACLARNAQAVAHLRAQCRPVLHRYLSRVPKGQSLVDEVEQRLWDTMLLGEAPRLASYAGRGPLGAWLGISAQRLALMALRHEQAETRARREAAAHRQLADADPELATIKERYRAEFQAAFAAALAALDDRERMLYRLHLVEGRSFDDLAKTYQVHSVTVRRWLTAASRKVLQRAKEELRKTLPVSSAEFESVARLLARDLHVSISHSLKSK
jgi:RNA polymerase sigma-70 factor (ECF subfamily)